MSVSLLSPSNTVREAYQTPERRKRTDPAAEDPVWDDAGIQALWRQTLGDPEVCVAILDGPVEMAHRSFDGAPIELVPSLVSSIADMGPASRHGTHIASLIFGQHHGPVRGLAPRCRGVIIPIFESADDQSFQSCSQLDLARAIDQAIQHGAHIINISGGEFTPSGTAYPLLADTVRACSDSGILVVSATGNESCECPHIPAALSPVLAVGAMNRRGDPLEFSNWGGAYQHQGVLAVGDDLLGAEPGGSTAYRTGTSYATAVVTGVAALFLSLQRKLGRPIAPYLVRDAILHTALGCESTRIKDCRRLLAGRLNVEGAMSRLLLEENAPMSDSIETQTVDSPTRVETVDTSCPPTIPSPAPPATVIPSGVWPSECACGKAAATPQWVFALGQLGHDFTSEARLDSIAQKMAGVANGKNGSRRNSNGGNSNGSVFPSRAVAYSREHVLAHLEDEDHFADAASFEWTLNLDGTTIYAIRPFGPFAAQTYRSLRDALKSQHAHHLNGDEIARVSIPGVIAGNTRLLSGQVVPVIIPEPRGMFQWTTGHLVEELEKEGPLSEKHKTLLLNFLDRVYHELRNLGVTAQDRAINYAGTNVHEMLEISRDVLESSERMELDSIQVTRSSICRPSSDCWDVNVYFFYPERQVQTVRKIHRYTVDVSDVVPVTVGRMRSWFTR
jgi:hypothetical protein